VRHPPRLVRRGTAELKAIQDKRFRLRITGAVAPVFGSD
jgi:hypothetical protein